MPERWRSRGACEALFDPIDGFLPARPILRPGQYLPPGPALPEDLAQGFPVGRPEPGFAQARVLGMVGEDEQTVRGRRLWMLPLGGEQGVEANLATFLARQFGAALGAPHGAAAFRPIRANPGTILLG